MTNKNNKSKKSPKGANKPKQQKQQTNRVPRPVVVTKPQSSFGEDIGSLVGKGVNALGKYLGFGAYTVNQNSIIGAGGSIPTMHSTNDSIMVRHREYIGDVLSSTTFSSVSIPLNPGLITSYPWLSKIASAFQQYKIKGMVVEFIPEVSEVAASEVSLGFVALAAEYRTDLPPFPSLNQALESQFAVSCKPNSNCSLAIECDPAQSPYNLWYVRTGSVPSGEDIKTFDFVDLNVLVGNNQTGGVILGQIWNSYEIELLRPTSFLDPPAGQFYMRIHSTGSTSANPFNGFVVPAYTNPIGTNIVGATVTQQLAADGGTIGNPGNGQMSITLPRGLTGDFLVTFTCTGGATALLLANATLTLTNATGLGILSNASSQGAPNVAQTASIVMMDAAFTISDAQASTGQAVVVLGGSSLVLPTSPLMDLVIAQITSAAT